MGLAGTCRRRSRRDSRPQLPPPGPGPAHLCRVPAAGCRNGRHHSRSCDVSMTLVMAPVPASADPPEPARRVDTASSGADRIFRLYLLASGLTVLIIMGTIGLFLFYRGSQA